jgi:citrate synthase
MIAPANRTRCQLRMGRCARWDLRQIKTGADDFGLMAYDPALMNTASTKSAITFIDGDKGILEYRGYPVEQLAERCKLFGSRLLNSFW